MNFFHAETGRSNDPITEESKEKALYNPEPDQPDEEFNFEEIINLDSDGHESEKFVPIDILYATANSYVFQMVKIGDSKPVVVKMPKKYISIEKEVEMSRKISKLGETYFMQFIETHRFFVKGMNTQMMVFEGGLDSMENILKKRKNIRKKYIELKHFFMQSLLWLNSSMKHR